MSPVNSAIYEGWVSHRRTEPVDHGFRYRLFLPLFDLDELPELLDEVPFWSARRSAPARWKRSDYLGDPATPLAEAARERVRAETGSAPSGPVRLLANPRYLGYGINPVAFYFLYGRDEQAGVEAMIADVTNTPWGESRSYVLTGEGAAMRGDFDKNLHVSPFMPMQQTYSWTASDPGEQLRVSITNHDSEGRPVFNAAISMERREMTPRALTRLLFRYPPMTLSTFARIYSNALKLKLKGAPYHPNPDQGQPA